MIHWFCLSVQLVTTLLRVIENTGCGIMSVSHTPNQAMLRTLVMLNSGLCPSFNITQCSQLGLVWVMGHWYNGPYISVPYVSVPYVSVPYVSVPYVSIPYGSVECVSSIPAVSALWLCLAWPRWHAMAGIDWWQPYTCSYWLAGRAAIGWPHSLHSLDRHCQHTTLPAHNTATLPAHNTARLSDVS